MNSNIFLLMEDNLKLFKSKMTFVDSLPHYFMGQKPFVIKWLASIGSPELGKALPQLVSYIILPNKGIIVSDKVLDWQYLTGKSRISHI